MGDCFWTDLRQAEQPECGGVGASFWMLTLASDIGVVLFPEAWGNGDTSNGMSVQTGDTVTVTGGTFWYNNGSDCQYSGCSMWLAYDSDTHKYIPNTGAPIAGTTAIPFDEFYSAPTDPDANTWVTPSGDPARPCGSTNAGIIGNCGTDAWSTQAAGDPVSFAVAALWDSDEQGSFGPNLIDAVGYNTNYGGTMHDLIGQLFGFVPDENGQIQPAPISWFAHIAMRNERTGDVYHVMLYDNYCF